MTSHVEQQVAARIAAAKRKAEERQRRRAELAAARKAGLAKRNARRLFNLAQSALDNTTPAASSC